MLESSTWHKRLIGSKIKTKVMSRALQEITVQVWRCENTKLYNYKKMWPLTQIWTLQISIKWSKQRARKQLTNRWEMEWCSSQLKRFQILFKMATEKFWTNAENVQMALEKCWMGDAFHLNDRGNILKGWLQPFTQLTKKFEQMMPTIWRAKEKFQTGDARYSNC